MSTNQINTHDRSTDSKTTKTAISDNLVNANSVDDIYVYRDGNQLAVSTPVQTAEFHLDQLVYIYEGQMDVFQQVFESRGDILDLWWTPDGFTAVVYDGRERHTVQFVIRQEAGDFR